MDSERLVGIRNFQATLSYLSLYSWTNVDASVRETLIITCTSFPNAGETFVLFNKNTKGTKRELIQLGIPIFGNTTDEHSGKIKGQLVHASFFFFFRIFLNQTTFSLFFKRLVRVCSSGTYPNPSWKCDWSSSSVAFDSWIQTTQWLCDQLLWWGSYNCILSIDLHPHPT